MFHHRIDDHITLHLTHPRFANAVFEITDRNRDHISPWLPWIAQTHTVADTRGWIDATRAEFAEGKALPLIICYDDAPVGSVGLHIRQAHSRGEIGYWLDQAHTGRGIMTRACAYVIQQAFEEYQLNRVEIRAAVHNTRSRAIPERFGFVQEGVLRQMFWVNDEPQDIVIYGKLRAEWEQEARP